MKRSVLAERGRKSAAPARRADLRFDDNMLLAGLVGDHDRHLVRIETALGVSIASRGNEVAISGPEGAVDAARATLEHLYRRLEQGMAVEPGDVDGALRLARGGRLSTPAETGSEAASTAATGVVRTRKRVIEARSPRQAEYLEAIRSNTLTFGLGPAGTGKTYLAVAAGVQMMAAGEVERIILSRPAVEAGERLGFLPGDLKDKVDPYLRPLYDALFDMLPGDQVARQIESGEIEIAPLAFMRGRTLAHAFVILDEAQNTTPVQMKMFLTRIGEGARMVVAGDLSQVDLPVSARSGLADALDVVDGLPEVGVVRFTQADVVRHALVTRIVQAYDTRDAARKRDHGHE